MSGKYYPNNWEHYKDAPDDIFEPHTFEEVMTWKVAGWQIHSSVCCIIRAETKGKVKEFVYQKQQAAENQVKSLMAVGAEFTVCTDSASHLVSSNNTDVIDFD